MLEEVLYLTLFLDTQREIFCTTPIRVCTWRGKIEEAKLVYTLPPSEWFNVVQHKTVEWRCPCCDWRIGSYTV